jgi:hypothetical protein
MLTRQILQHVLKNYGSEKTAVAVTPDATSVYHITNQNRKHKYKHL